MKSVVKPVVVSLVQLLPFVVAVGSGCNFRRVGRGRRVNLEQVAPATLRPIRGLRAATNTRPDVPLTPHAAGLFRQQDGSGWIANHLILITLCPPIGGRSSTRGPVN